MKLTANERHTLCLMAHLAIDYEWSAADSVLQEPERSERERECVKTVKRFEMLRDKLLKAE